MLVAEGERRRFQSAFLDPQMALGGSIEGLVGAEVLRRLGRRGVRLEPARRLRRARSRRRRSILFNHLQVDSGGFKRNNDGLSSYDNNEWILVDLRISERAAPRRRAAPTPTATSAQRRQRRRPSNFFLLPELYNDTAADGADRQILRLDPDGRLRRRRVHHDDPRSRRAAGSRTTAATATRARRRLQLLGPDSGGDRRHRRRRLGRHAGGGAATAARRDATSRIAPACLCDLARAHPRRRGARSAIAGAAVALPRVPPVRQGQVQVTRRRRMQPSAARLVMRGIARASAACVALDGAELAARGRRDPRPVRRERRRQVDAAQDPRRRLPARQLTTGDGARRRRGASCCARRRTRARAGIAIVHQELMLVPEMTVAENLLLGREPRRFGLVDDAALEAQARALLARFGDERHRRARAGRRRSASACSRSSRSCAPCRTTPACSCSTSRPPRSPATRRRACSRGCAGCAPRGTTCIYVSHRMDEVFALCDRITVLRDGRTVGTLDDRALDAATRWCR